MEFRIVALIALWTLLSGPVFSTPDSVPSAPAEVASASPAPPPHPGLPPGQR